MIPPEVVALSPYAPAWVARSARRSRRSRQHVRDRRGRVVEIGEWQPEDWDGLLAMYLSLDPAQRTQGLPPLGEERQAVWLDQLLGRGPNVVARADGRVVGHAALVSDDGGGPYELVVFVHHGYQDAGIGGALVGAVRWLARRMSVRSPSLSRAPVPRAVRRVARAWRSGTVRAARLLRTAQRPGATAWDASRHPVRNDTTGEAIGG
jgi:GNAT superfamily N-acetyltransferase